MHEPPRYVTWRPRAISTKSGKPHRPEVNVTSYSVGAFRKQGAEGDHFLATVLKSNVQFVKGEQRDLDAVARK